MRVARPIGSTVSACQSLFCWKILRPLPYAQLEGKVRTEVDHFALYVDDLDAVFETLQGRGIPFRDRPHTTELGHRNMQRSLVSLKDPNGFTVQPVPDC